ncbi:heme exporter protein CcmD [Thalassolituus sp.]|jgi:heme exporter protein D|uniref:heme exporter protein CcmD n=1 Tax=Thalassolituus sp. TaxID=2030822 RepID=UPI002A82B821|nr:heme exporter protein CcmD [Thalassolituus sp.]|tara:strand:- start:348 stop:536 length:189 start_codon:yes stop_codon:yes gene_type:complete
MEFNSFAEFIAMGKHGLYVWLSYGITAVIVAVNVVQPILRRRRLMKEQAQRLRREKHNAPSA